MTKEQIDEALKLGFSILTDKKDKDFEEVYLVLHKEPSEIQLNKLLSILSVDDEIVFYNGDYKINRSECGAHFYVEKLDCETYRSFVREKCFHMTYIHSLFMLTRVIRNTWSHKDGYGNYEDCILVRKRKCMY
ncbi:MAG: hypothetical protein MJ245_01505 [Clostridia bacterium]|nr:hypothetical protein [Clostridia bacterium]